MTRRPLGGRSLAVVARFHCAVCDSVGRVRLVALAGMRGTGVATCPHCSPEPGREPVHIRIYRPRCDVPRDETA